MKRRITEKQITGFKRYLQNQERSRATIEKYVRDIRKYSQFLNGSRISREQVVAYKQYLIEQYKVTSVNSMLAALNHFLAWQGLTDYKVKPLKIQRQIFRSEEKELTKKDYHRLLGAARKMNDERLYLVMQTICATGIRISELQFITAESLQEGYIQVNCKNKIYPHNLRHLFARTFYETNKDIIKLADILGHSSVETTRIYTMTSGREHAGYLEKLGLICEHT